MNFLETVMEKWNMLMAKIKPVAETAKNACAEVARIVKIGAGYVIKMRKIFLAIPVVWGAIYLAIYNQANLPAIVGLDLQINGDFNFQVIRELAVLGPVVITGVCLLLMFCSRRLLTPWLVSMFSLLLPVFILVTNTFPA
ncbi:MAG: hypothetical protein J6A88_00900 [Oscillospiraceae bacterium]|nr:hypothetical protein [Oscillospiraceae bacterium]